MKLAIAVEQVQCWLSEIQISLQFCVDNYLACLKAFFNPHSDQIEQIHIQTIDENLEQSFKKLILADNQLEHIWAIYVVHDDCVQLKNMIDNEHLYNRLEKELKDFMFHYRGNTIESDKQKLDNSSCVTHNTSILKI